MAALSNHDGLRMIRFARPDGSKRRATIRLGRVSAKDAHVTLAHIEALIGHVASCSSLPPATAAWLQSIGDRMHAKLAKTGLVRPRGASTARRIGTHLDDYIARRTDLKPRTVLNLRQAQASLIAHFGAARDMATITRSEAKDWRRQLARGKAVATVATHVKKARQMFDDAVDRDLIGRNPFRSVKAGSMANVDRQQYVPALDIERVIEACPDHEWKLIFALARFAGLRVSSETLALRWADVWWDAGRMLIRSPKTEHHAGRSSRIIPIFPDLLPYLRDAFERATDGVEHVLELHRGGNVSTTGRKIIERAGLELWPRTFQNLRSSFQTDLTSRFPIHVACAWAGNTEAVALTHYLQVTDEHFDRAVKGAPKSAPQPDAGNAGGSSPETQNPPETEGFAPVMYPQGGANPAAFLADNLNVSAKALQKALHRLTEAAPHIRAYDLDRLERELLAARRGGGL